MKRGSDRAAGFREASRTGYWRPETAEILVSAWERSEEPRSEKVARRVRLDPPAFW
jgi:hypothetical protein